MMYLVQCNGKLHGPFGQADYATRWAELTLMGAASWSVVPMVEIGVPNQAYEREIDRLKQEGGQQRLRISDLEEANRRLRKQNRKRK